MATVESDPLCGGSHPVKSSQGGKEYYYCSVSHSTVWLTSPITRQRILGNGPIRANPSHDEPLPREPRNPNFQPSVIFPPESLETETEPEPSHSRTLAEKIEELGRLRRARLLRERGIDPDEGG